MADCKRKTANLFDIESWITANGTTYTKSGNSYTFDTRQSMYSTPYYFSETDIAISISGILENVSSVNARIDLLHADGTVSSGNVITDSQAKSENIYAAGLRFNWSTGGTVTLSNIMLNTGSTALPYEPYWQHSLRKLTTSTDTLTTLPVDLYADGNSATVGLQGNMTQTGTPTPENPITPQETGDRTENLFDYKTVYSSYIDNNGNIATTANNLTQWNYFTADEIGKTFTISLYVDSISASYIRVQGQINESYITGNAINAGSTGFTEITVTPTSTSDRWRITYGTGTPNVVLNQVMVAVSSTRKEYEPYGIKIPILSGGTTTPVYPGEVESTRNVYKMIFTGEETFTDVASGSKKYFRTYIRDIPCKPQTYEVICTHYSYAYITSDTTNIGVMSSVPTGGAAIYFRPENVSSTSIDDFKTFLANQYAAGTPVTVWYVLAEPTTGIVNEPLRKIGDYADTVSSISIPTITGKDSFDIQTTLKPSEVSLAYTGWHDAEVKEWDGSQWQ